MEIKRKIKIIVDILMVIGMFCAVNYQIWSGSAHKRISAMLYLLFVLHNVLNYRWYKALFRGKYKPFRVMQTIVNVLVMLSMIGIIYSGVLLAKEVSGGIVTDGISFARILHILAGYIGAFGMMVHGGLHVKVIRLRVQSIMSGTLKLS